MSRIEDVLLELDAHKPTHAEYTGGWWELACTGCDFANGRRLSHLDWTPHHAHRAEIFAAALSAAGFGLVADAKAEAWDEAYKLGVDDERTNPGIAGCFCHGSPCHCFIAPARVNPYRATP